MVLTAYRYAHNGGGGVGRFLESTLFVKYGNDEHFLFELPIKYGSDCQSLGFDIKKKNEIEFRTSLKKQFPILFCPSAHNVTIRVVRKFSWMIKMRVRPPGLFA